MRSMSACSGHAADPAHESVPCGPQNARMNFALEHWEVDAGDADIATLDIPPGIGRARRFRIDVRFVVRGPAGSAAAWHAMTVEANGQREWQRRIATHGDGETDSLDYAFSAEVPPGSALRVRALTQVHAAVLRRRLRIEATEQ
jgi:hypothetical protein